LTCYLDPVRADATAGIVIIGDEILSGQFADENAAFLIGELRTLGVSLRRIAMIPDDVEDIGATVLDFSRRFDHVFTSGGVGPTHDDVTIAGIAAGFGTEVVRHPEIEALLRKYIGDNLHEGHLRMADVPNGAEVLYGRDPLSPVVLYKNVYILPGIPALFRSKVISIRERFRCAPFASGVLYTMGDESSIATDLHAAVAEYPEVAFGSYPRIDEPDYRILITVKGKDGSVVKHAIEWLAARLGPSVVRWQAPEISE